jgi:triphosphatase
MAEEIELKFFISPDQIPALRRHPLVKSWTHGRPVSRTLRSTYYDTPDLKLHTRGVALRLRRIGRRWIQTVKTGGTALAGLQIRGEWETPARENAPQLDALQAPELKHLFDEAESLNSLAPCFVTAFKRSSRLLEWPNGDQVELAIDRGEIIAGEAREPICEVELEVKAGNPARVFEVVRHLLDSVSPRLANESKAERGYALASGQAPKPVKARAPRLDASMIASDAFVTVAQSCIAHLQANDRGLSEGCDTEYIHQMRIALRRLRSALGLFGDIVPRERATKIRDELRWLTKALDGARNWDVFETETLAAVGGELAALPGVAWVKEQVARRRAEHNAQARAAIDSKRYPALLLDLGLWLTTKGWRNDALASEAMPLDPPIVELANAILRKRHKRLREYGDRLLALSPSERHRVRIAAKKLRYAAEFFSSLFGHKQVRRYVAALSELQDVLGAMNDAATTGALLDELEGDPVEPAERAAIAIVRGWALGVSHAHSRDLARVWRQFEDQKKFW